jgi:hypothetical protein
MPAVSLGASAALLATPLSSARLHDGFGASHNFTPSTKGSPKKNSELWGWGNLRLQGLRVASAASLKQASKHASAIGHKENIAAESVHHTNNKEGKLDDAKSLKQGRPSGNFRACKSVARSASSASQYLPSPPW